MRVSHRALLVPLVSCHGRAPRGGVPLAVILPINLSGSVAVPLHPVLWWSSFQYHWVHVVGDLAARDPMWLWVQLRGSIHLSCRDPPITVSYPPRYCAMFQVMAFWNIQIPSMLAIHRLGCINQDDKGFLRVYDGACTSHLLRMGFFRTNFHSEFITDGGGG